MPQARTKLHEGQARRTESKQVVSGNARDGFFSTSVVAARLHKGGRERKGRLHKGHGGQRKAGLAAA